MGHACTHFDRGPQGRDPHEHPVVAVIAIIAIAAAIFLIAWAGLELHGTQDLEAALSEPQTEGDVLPKPDNRPNEEREVDHAVTSSRFATGFSP
jgi:hypothetical protein